MNEESESPSSSAARRAQNPRPGAEPNHGLLGKFFGSLSRVPETNSAAGPNSKLNGSNTPNAFPSSTHDWGLLRQPVENVAVPKAEIFAVPLDIELENLVNVFRSSGLSRLPVYEGSLDKPCGLVHMKDLALQYGFDSQEKEFSLESVLRPLLFVPPSMPVGVLLQKMQTERTHMALVIDEYGGVDGLATIEDLVEEVVGDIADEHDIVDEAEFWRMEAPGEYLCLAKAPLRDFEVETGIDLGVEGGDEEIDTLGGLVFVLAGRVPDLGEVITHPNGSSIVIVDADLRRIKRLKVKLQGDRKV